LVFVNKKKYSSRQTPTQRCGGGSGEKWGGVDLPRKTFLFKPACGFIGGTAFAGGYFPPRVPPMSGGWWHIQHQTPQSRTGERNKAKATAAFPAKRAGVPAFGGISYRRFSREASARVAFGQRDLDPKGAGGWPWAFSSSGFYVEMVPKKWGGFLESIDI